MERNKFLCVGWLPILLCSLLLLLITASMKARIVENKVKESAINALSDEQLSWAEVETYNMGRQVIISGAAPSNDEIEQALTVVRQAPGVLNASHNGEAIAPTPLEAPTLKISMADQSVELAGTLSSQNNIDLVMDRARRTFSNINIKNSMKVGKNIAPLSNADFISALTLNGDAPSQITVELDKQNLTLKGAVVKNSIREQIESRLSKTFNGNIINSLTVSPKLCSDVVNKELADEKINFESGKATISASSFAVLERVIKAIKRCPSTKYEVAGHTDNSGNADFNLKLSERRAQAVTDYLLEQGLNSDQFKAQGYGPNVPVADNESAEGRAQNRRIEFKLAN